MSDFYVGQKVRVTRDFIHLWARNGGYKKGNMITVSYVDYKGRPSFVGDKCQEIGWGSAGSWTTPITTPEPEIELTQVRILGRLYNLVPVKGE